MTTALSRRGLFRAFCPDSATAPSQPEAVTGGLLARAGEACVEPRGVTCRRCGDECEAGAISFRLLGAGRARVAVDDERCTGCGACLAVCPTQALSLVAADRVAVVAGLVAAGSVS
jgi:ferredoxin-type protein NapF